MQTMGARLKALRIEKKLTQSEAAKILHVQQPTYCEYELDKKRPSYETLIAIADLYKVSTDYLLGRY